MKTNQLSNWLSLIANFSILAGLVLVAFELNQNSELARVALINDENAAVNELMTSMMGENASDVLAKAMECPAQMSYADYMAVDSYLYTSMNIVYRNYEISKEGLFTNSEWKADVANYAHWYLDSEFGRAWWMEEGAHFFDDEFSAHVTKHLEQQGVGTVEYWHRVRARILSIRGSEPPISSVCIASGAPAN